MRGKKTSTRMKEKIFQSNVDKALSFNVPLDEVPKSVIARDVGLPEQTVRNVMSEEEFSELVAIKKRELAQDQLELLENINKSMIQDFSNDRFDKANPISKYTAYGVIADKFNILVGRDDQRINFTQNIVNVSEEITKILARTQEPPKDEKTA